MDDYYNDQRRKSVRAWLSNRADIIPDDGEFERHVKYLDVWEDYKAWCGLRPKLANWELSPALRQFRHIKMYSRPPNDGRKYPVVYVAGLRLRARAG